MRAAALPHSDGSRVFVTGYISAVLLPPRFLAEDKNAQPYTSGDESMISRQPSRQPSRRRFMQGAAATAAAGFWVWNQRAYAESKSPNEKLNIAWIGVGGKGDSDSNQAGNVGNLVAICDVDDKTLANKGEKFPDAQQ